MAHSHISACFLVMGMASMFQNSAGVSSDGDVLRSQSSLVRRESHALDLEQTDSDPVPVSLEDSTHRPHACKYFTPWMGEATCPDRQWIEAMVKVDPSPGKVILDIGCNRGDNAVKWMELYDLSPMPLWSLNKFRGVIKDILPTNETDACGPVVPPVKAARHHHPNAYLSSRSSPRVVCIESEKTKIDALMQASAALGYGVGTASGSLHIVHAFVENNASTTATASAAGKQTAKTNSSLYGPNQPPYNINASVSTVEAPHKSVDQIMSELEIPRVDIMTMDLYGTDPDVLQGAEKTLRFARYLEFGVHPAQHIKSWSSTTLHNVVTDLDRQGFDCFFAGNRGRLMPIKTCWKKEFERVGEAKVACIRKGDIWDHHVFGKFDGRW